MLWVTTLGRTSVCWLGHRTAATAAPGRRLSRPNALSICHRRPYTRLGRAPGGRSRNRRTIRRRSLVRGHRRVPRQFGATTVERTPRSRGGTAWLASES
jgi:hypothetical protein